MNILKDMYYGNIPSFIELNPRSENYDEIMKKILMFQDEIIKEFPDAKEIFEKYRDATEEYNSKLQENAFFEGLSFGIKIMTSVFSDNQ